MELNVKILPPLLITTVIAVLMVSSILIPTITEAQHAQDVVYSNNNPNSHGVLWGEEQLSEESITIAINTANTHSIKINDVTYTTPTWQVMWLSDAFAVRYYGDSLGYFSPSGTYSATEVDITVSQGIASVTVTRQSGTITIVSESYNITWAYVYNPDGDYTAFTIESGSTTKFYGVKEKIYAANWVSSTNSFFSLAEGVVTLTKNGEVSHPELSFDGTYLDNGVYSWTSGTDLYFTVDNSGTPYNVHPFLVCMPREFIGVPDENQPINAIIGIIPLLVLTGLVIGVVGSFIRNRD